MEKRNFRPAFSVLEVFLPLILFRDEMIFIAAALVPCIAGITLVWLEFLRRQPPRIMSAFYLAWLALCGLGAWYGLGVAPYWIWSAHILISETARQPSLAQRKKPFLFGFKKYTVRRAREFVFVLAGSLAVAGGLFYLRGQMSGISVWAIAALALVVAQIVLGLVRKEKA
jgi:hypothetical protein